LHIFTYGTSTVSDSTFNLYGGSQTKWTGTSVYHFNNLGQVVYVEKSGPSTNDNWVTYLFYAKNGLIETERVRYRDGIEYDSVYEFFITP
jgi:hypothetical protein